MDFHKPAQTVLVTSRSEDVDNVIPCSFHMPVSVEPERYAIAVEKETLTKSLIEKSKVFVVNFMPYRYVDEVKKCNLISGKHVNKFDNTALRKADCNKVDCSYIKESSAFIECELVNSIDSGDHIILIGEIINQTSNNDEKRLLQKDNNSFTTTIH